jgi:hypothetical protein
MDIKAFVAALTHLNPKQRAAAWRKLTPKKCAAAWAALTPQQRKADGDALAIAWIDEASSPEDKRMREQHVDATKRLAAKGVLIDAGRRNGQVVSVAAGYLPPEDIERLLEGPIKHRALGANAFFRGRAITDNPHPADTPAHQDWDFGFRAASAIADNKAIADNVSANDVAADEAGPLH